MPFVQVDIESEIHKRKEANDKFNAIWEESREEYRLIGEECKKKNKCNSIK